MAKRLTAMEEKTAGQLITDGEVDYFLRGAARGRKRRQNPVVKGTRGGAECSDDAEK